MWNTLYCKKNNNNNCKILDLRPHEVCFSSLSLGPELMPTASGGAQPDPGLCGGRPPTAEQQRSSRREAHTTIWEVFSHNPRQRQWPQSLRYHFLQTLCHIFLLGEWRGLRHSYQVRGLQLFCLCCCLLYSRSSLLLCQNKWLVFSSILSPKSHLERLSPLTPYWPYLLNHLQMLFDKTITFKWFKQQMWAIK